MPRAFCVITRAQDWEMSRVCLIPATCRMKNTATHQASARFLRRALRPNWIRAKWLLQVLVSSSGTANFVERKRIQIRPHAIGWSSRILSRSAAAAGCGSIIPSITGMRLIPIICSSNRMDNFHWACGSLHRRIGRKIKNSPREKPGLFASYLARSYAGTWKVVGRMGSCRKKVLPGNIVSSCPGLTTQTLPPWARATPRTRARPSPGPPPLNVVFPEE